MRLRLSHKLAGLVIALAAVAFAQGSPERKPITIAQARKTPAGTRVTIAGAVTIPSALFKSSFEDDGFVIEDATSAIYVSVNGGRALKIGDSVRVTGQMSETNAQFVIVKADAAPIAARARQQPIAPRRVAASGIGSQNIGQLVELSGAITTPIVNIPPAGYRFTVNDGQGDAVVYVSSSTGIPPERFANGARVRIAGIVAQYKGQYQLLARLPADVH
jgi:cytochrome c-type biogenesis protein CcmE